ncbi:MAG: hypothetical protein AABX25_04245 [Nanoarchaeota archaeon]
MYWYEKEDPSGTKIDTVRLDYLAGENTKSIVLATNTQSYTKLKAIAKACGKSMQQSGREAIAYLVQYWDKVNEGYKLLYMSKDGKFSKKKGVILLLYYQSCKP